jgi:uncharacterized membrane protein
LKRVASLSLGNPAVKAALQGRVAGHSIHPAMVDFPLGSLTSALLLDLVQGPRAAEASKLLIATATMSFAPAAATGLAEWADADERTQRVGSAHAALNLVGGVLTAGSWLARERGHWKGGVWLCSAALTALTVSAYLGGHMALVRKYATHDAPGDLAGATSGVRPTAS